MNIQEETIIKAIKSFDFGNYGMDDVSYRIEEDLEAQEWIPDLAHHIAEELTSA